jgi:predicted dehydrogenase
MGIIGSENSHAIAVADIINVRKRVKGIAVTHVWGETDEFARAAAEKGRIPTIVRDPRAMLGEVDCVMADHRDGRYHADAVRPFLNAGIPCFVDKPLTCSLAEARSLLALAKRKNAALTSFSALVVQSCIPRIRKELEGLGKRRVAHINGPGDYKSPYSGIFFYGIHVTDLLVEFFGPEAARVSASKNGANCTAVVNYPEGFTVTLNFFTGGPWTWSVAAVGEKGSMMRDIVSDADFYLNGVRTIVRMFKTGKPPFDDKRLLAPIAILEAIWKSLDSDRPVTVNRL